MELSEILDELEPEQRLAVAYTPKSAKAVTLGLLTLDRRLRDVVLHSREPLLTQIRLAWWRDRLSESPEHWPKGEPLLALLRAWGEGARGLTQLVDGWEVLLDENLDPDTAQTALARARAEAFVALGALLGCGAQEDAIRQTAFGWAQSESAWKGPLPPIRLPKSMRGLAVLYGLARRSAANPHGALQNRPTDFVVAVRIGLIGR